MPRPLIDVTERHGSNTIAFSRDGHLLARGDGEGGIQVYELSEARQLSALRSHDAHVTGLSFGAGNSLFSGTTKIGRGGGGSIARDTLNGDEHRAISLQEHNGVGWLGYSHAADILICIPMPGMRMRFYDPNTLEHQSTIDVPSTAPRETLSSAAIGESGRLLALLTTKGVVVWDIVERRQLARASGKHAVAVNEAIGKIATVPPSAGVGPPSEVLLISASDGAVAARVRGQNRQIGRLAFSGDGRYLVAGGLDSGDINIWDMTTLECVRSFNPFGEYIYVAAVAVSPDGSLLAACPRKPRLVVWKMADLIPKAGETKGEKYHHYHGGKGETADQGWRDKRGEVPSLPRRKRGDGGKGEKSN